MKRALLLAVTHALALAIGFGAGIYFLPILIAPETPSASEVGKASANAEFRGEFRRDLKGSDFLHWGEGTVSVGRGAISFSGKLAPGPDYKLFLSPEFVETRSDFVRLKPRMAKVGDVKSFESFILAVPPGIDLRAYDTVIVWCETFGQFITAARYK